MVCTSSEDPCKPTTPYSFMAIIENMNYYVHIGMFFTMCKTQELVKSTTGFSSYSTSSSLLRFYLQKFGHSSIKTLPGYKRLALCFKQDFSIIYIQKQMQLN